MDAWLGTQISADAMGIVSRFIAICTVFFAIAWLCFTLFRKLNKNALIRKKRSVRLSVCDIVPIDDSRRIVLVRRDTVEHLILLGGHGDIIIEHNISVSKVPAVHENPIHSSSSKAGSKPGIKAPPLSQLKEVTKIQSASTNQAKGYTVQVSVPDSPAIATSSKDMPEALKSATMQQKDPGLQISPSLDIPMVEGSPSSVNVGAEQPVKRILPKNSIPSLDVSRWSEMSPVQFRQHPSYTDKEYPVNYSIANKTSVVHQKEAAFPSSEHRHKPEMSSSFHIQQNGGVIPRPITITGHLDGTGNRITPYLANPEQSLTSPALTMMSNSTSDSVSVQDDNFMSFADDASYKSNPHMESVKSESQKRQQLGFRITDQPAKESFEKILQEELIRTKTNIKLSSQNES
ncbi:MAG: hypothetical protein JSC188_000491 [Candidatus Tokpelaia sp. JSC188]|nr:MAG: hypothetical protein JSC188_000491 [Candidatus Tokpelaia sp. JSC188]